VNTHICSLFQLGSRRKGNRNPTIAAHELHQRQPGHQ
jgi:hypothetical protein